jgi:hypothetical protein
MAGASGDITTAAALNTAVQALTAAGITRQVVSDNGNPPAAADYVTWSPTGGYLQTRPTGIKFIALMAALINNTGADQKSFQLGCTFSQQAIANEQINGHLVYYSLTGAAKSWTNIPTLSSAAPGNLTATISAPWSKGGTLYLLWADDNGSPSQDTANQIHDFFINPTQVPPFILSLAPISAAVNEGAPASFTVTAAGTPPLSYQWRKIITASTDILPSQTNATCSIAAAALNDAAAYCVVITNVFGSVTSAVATLSVRKAPSALGVSVLDRRGLYVSFSTNMDAITALDASRYHLNHGITVTNAAFVPALGTNGPQSVVRLDVQPLLDFFPDYSLAISNVFGAGGLPSITPNPTVLPFHLDYRNLGYLYLSPVPGAEYVSPQTRFVLVRFKDVSPDTLTNLSTFVTVTGSSTGIHSGQTHVAMDGRTVIYQMTTVFSLGESVTVSLAPYSTSSPSLGACEYQFVVGGHSPDVGSITVLGDNLACQGRGKALDGDQTTEWLDHIVPNSTITNSGDNLAVGWTNPDQTTVASSEVLPGTVLSPRIGGASAGAVPIASQKSAGLTPKFAIMPNGVSVPSDFPQVMVTARGNPASDYIWLESVGQNGQMYKMILDTWGNPVFYQRGGAMDFKPQKNGLLTWKGFTAVDKNFNYVGSYFAANGYGTDEHELQILADGTYFLIGDGTESVDMSRFVTNGNPAASVMENVVQQFTSAGELIFQWRAWDHLDILDQQQSIDITAQSFDFPHMNALDVDDDGHILLSSRSPSECTKINRDTGEIIWRLGGTHSTLTFVNDPLNGPRDQHGFRALGRGHYILFDNGNLHDPPVSRAVEYAVDPLAKTATLVWQFRDTPDKYAFYMGNVQRLTNGNTHINWVYAGYPKACEVDSNGVKQLELNLTPGRDLYRSWRSPWDGVVPVPYLIVEPYPDNVTLIYNKFGDTNVGSYRIYGGTSPQPTALLATTPSTLAHLNNLQNNQQYYFRVTAVAKDGTESGYSNEETVMVNLVQPGQNLVQNGDFSAGTNGWTWVTNNTGSGTFNVVTGTCLIHITSAGTALSDLQLRQSGLKLIQGKQYVLEFDGSAVGGTHPIDIKLGQDQLPFAIYYTAAPTLRTTPQHFTCGFTMTGATDLDTRLMFNLGGLARDVVLDNISLYMAYNSQVTVILQTLPGGLTVEVDGTDYAAPASFTWVTNSFHTLSVADAQISADGHARYPFLSWSDGRAPTHTVITPRLDTNYTASFSTQFRLDLAVVPADGGNITPLPPEPWYPLNQMVSLTANPNPGFKFLYWNGVDTHSKNTAQVTMDGYRNVTATFRAVGPVIIDPHSVVRLVDGTVQFGVTAPGAATVTVLGSTNLSTWQVLQTVPVTNGAAVFTDSAATNFPSRFYRVRLL